jgi:hypothetical protein
MNQNNKPKQTVKKKYNPKYKSYHKKTYKVRDKGILLSRVDYFKKNYTFPFIIQSIMVAISAVSIFRNEYGAWFIFVFTLTSMAVMIFFGNRSYSKYKQFYKEH